MISSSESFSFFSLDLLGAGNLETSAFFTGVVSGWVFETFSGDERSVVPFTFSSGFLESVVTITQSLKNNVC